MRQMTILQNGVSGSTLSRFSGVPPVRTANQGWTSHAAARNARFLRSVPPDSLSGQGYAVTLTIKDCPASAKLWGGVVRRWLKRLGRLGLVRYHALTEWQKRRCPHLHAAVWFPEGLSPARCMDALLRAWVEVAGEFGAQMNAQHVKGIDGVLGWFRYLDKHATRSVRNYQRSGDSVPVGWKSTGRIWQRGGQWVVVEGVQVVPDDAAFFAARRLRRSAAIAYYRGRNEFKAMAHARNMLTDPDPKRSNVRPFSGWVAMADTVRFLRLQQAQGRSVSFPEGVCGHLGEDVASA